MRRFVYICFVALACSAPAHASLLGFRHKHEVVRLNEKIFGSVVDFTNNHGVDRRFWSESLGCKRDMYVYLPPGYDPKNRYPVMLWLHGFIQDEKDFLELAVLFDRSIANGCLPPMVIAAPDGSIRGRPSLLASGSFYINSRAGRFEDYIAFDVWNLIDHTQTHHDEAYDQLLVNERETTRVRLTLKNGSTRDRTIAHPRGTGDRVLTNADIFVKYRSLTRSVISADRQSAIEKTVLDVDTIDDIEELTALLTPTVRSALE